MGQKKDSMLLVHLHRKKTVKEQVGISPVFTSLFSWVSASSIEGIKIRQMCQQQHQPKADTDQRYINI